MSNRATLGARLLGGVATLALVSVAGAQAQTTPVQSLPTANASVPSSFTIVFV